MTPTPDMHPRSGYPVCGLGKRTTAPEETVEALQSLVAEELLKGPTRLSGGPCILY